MRRLLTALGFAFALAPVAGQADQTVFLELFTSQGCSSCPPADALLADLAQHDDIVAVSLHVDYWDYLGWTDSLADPKWTERQAAYAHLRHDRSVFTPQMVVQGDQAVIGSRPVDVADAITAARAQPPKVRLGWDGDQLTGSVAQGQGDLSVLLIEIIPEVDVSIEGGENTGLMPTYINAVSAMEQIVQWRSDDDPSFEWQAQHPRSPERDYVVIVQEAPIGSVLAVQRLD